MNTSIPMTRMTSAPVPPLAYDQRHVRRSSRVPVPLLYPLTPESTLSLSVTPPCTPPASPPPERHRFRDFKNKVLNKLVDVYALLVCCFASKNV